MSGMDNSDHNCYWGQRDNEPNGDSQGQSIESKQNDFSNMGTWIESDPEIHEGWILVIDNNDANAQDEHITQLMEDEFPQDHNQAGSGSVLEMYLDQQSLEGPWKAKENLK
ncbi:hypothetical protein DPV78_008085 [Talaromyces pinophilus]|nr:hypothetical protein DPV78_008085 [Talaromyces pinophilus]